MCVPSVVNAPWIWNIAKGPLTHFFFFCLLFVELLRKICVLFFVSFLFSFRVCMCFFSLYVHLFIRLFFLVIFPFGFWIALVCVRFCKLCSALFPNECVCVCVLAWMKEKNERLLLLLKHNSRCVCDSVCSCMCARSRRACI